VMSECRRRPHAYPAAAIIGEDERAIRAAKV
jgi:hypothetical protein